MLAAILGAIPFVGSAQNLHLHEALLDSLDRTVAAKDTYIKQEQDKVLRDMAQVHPGSANPLNFLSYQLIFYDYMYINSDSAIAYAGRMADLGKVTGNDTWTKRGMVLVNSVQALKSTHPVIDDAIKELPPITDIRPEDRAAYACMLMDNRLSYGYSFVVQKNHKQKCKELWEHMKPYVDIDGVYGLYYKVMLNDDSCTNAILSQLKNRGEAVKNSPTELSIMEYAISKVQMRQGKTDEAFRHLVLSAISAVKGVYRPSSALLDVVKTLYEKSDSCDRKTLERLNKYISLCAENVAIYHDYGRSREVSRMQELIYGRLHDMDLSHHRFVETGLFAVIILLVALLAFAVFRLIRSRGRAQAVIVTNKADNEMKEKLDKIEADLATSKCEIRQYMADLRTHDKIIIGIFLAMSRSIGDMKKQMKLMKNLLSTGLYKEAKKLVDSNTFAAQQDESLYTQFDQAFLTIHPDFIERFNRLLKPEGQFRLREPGSLTPELRIYALVCLGINDSGKIADVLQYSPQTVYNYRLRVRHTAAIPEKEFADAVMKLYDSSIVPV